MQESGTVQVLGMKKWMRHEPFPPSLYPHGRRSIKTLCNRAGWRHDKEVVGSNLTGQSYRDGDLAKWGVFPRGRFGKDIWHNGNSMSKCMKTAHKCLAHKCKAPTVRWLKAWNTVGHPGKCK